MGKREEKRHFLGTNRYGTSIIWVVVPIQTNNIVIHTPLHGIVVKKPHYLYSKAAGWHIIIGQANENFHFEKYQVCTCLGIAAHIKLLLTSKLNITYENK